MHEYDLITSTFNLLSLLCYYWILYLLNVDVAPHIIKKKLGPKTTISGVGPIGENSIFTPQKKQGGTNYERE